MRLRQTACLLAACMLAPPLAHAAPGFTDRCDDALPRQQIDDLTARLRAASTSNCRLGRIDTHGPRTILEWHHAGAAHTVLLAPRACLQGPTHTGRDLAAHLPAALSACPAALAALTDFLGAAHPLAPLLTDGWRPEEPPALDPRLVATFAWLALLVLFAFTLRRLSRRDLDRPWLVLAAALFALGLIARFAVPAAPANWYGAFLPRDGWGDLRFGAGAAVLQAAVRAVLPWTADAAFSLTRVLGALIAPLTVLLARRLDAALPAAALAGLLVTFAPIPVRLAASSSEHVLAGTLALAAWTTWLRTASDTALLPRLLTAALVALAALTRADCLPQLLLLPLWTTLHPASKRALPLRHRLRDAAAYLALLTVLALYTYLNIVRPSRHPGPELHGLVQTARHLLSQFWTVTSAPPHWLSPTAFILAAIALLAAIVHRQWRWLAAVLLSLALVFIPLGRNLLHDGLTGARYFILLPPLLAVLPLPLLAARRRLTVLLLALAAPLELLTSQPAWRHQTTFQAEYQFLRAALDTPRLNSPDCTLWFVRPRQPTHEPDLDCCLDPGASPLTLQFPDLRFSPLSAATPIPPGCNLYYEGAICSLDPTLAPASPQAADRILAACARLRERTHPIARTTVPLDTLTPRTPTAPTITLRLPDTTSNGSMPPLAPPPP